MDLIWEPHLMRPKGLITVYILMRLGGLITEKHNPKNAPGIAFDAIMKPTRTGREGAGIGNALSP